jgi:hypothetical protein
MTTQVFYKTKQEVFNKVWQHFIVDQNPRAYNPETDKCTYYSESGGCAIGCLIEDDDVKKVLDMAPTSSIYSLRSLYSEIFDKIIDTEVDKNFLGYLQIAHDDYTNDLKQLLIDLALDYNLIVPQ